MTFRDYRTYSKKSPESDTKFYTCELLGLYAAEDGFDQPLCKAARYLGYDIVILTHIEN